jgi:hypothetical protein
VFALLEQAKTVVDTAAADVAGLDGAAMRGTDNAALSSICTEERLSRLDVAVSTRSSHLASDITGGITVSELQTHGDSAWTTATGFSVHAPSDIWNVASRTLTTPASDFKATGFSTHAPSDIWAVETRTLTSSSNLNIPTSDAIADAVWNEAYAGHSDADTTGKMLSDASIGGEATISTADKEDIADYVWDELVSDHTGAGSTSEALSEASIGGTVSLTGANISDIADGVWDESVGDHVGAGSFGLAISDIEIGVVTSTEIADAVWDELVSDHTTAGTFGAYISDMTTLGTGATSKTYTVTDNDTGLPIGDVDVWVTTDSNGDNVIASGRTNSSGQITFYLDSGLTYYIWRQKGGYDFTNPDMEVA